MRRVLLLPLLVVAALAAAALAIVAATSRAATQDLEAQMRDVRRANALAFRLAHLTADEAEEVLALRVAPTAERADRIAAVAAEAAAIAGEIGALELPPRGRALWNEVVAATALRGREREALVEAVRSGDQERMALAYTRWELVTATTGAVVADLSAFNLRRLEGAVADVAGLRARSAGLFVAVLAASALVVLAFSVFVERHLVRPVQAMTEAARRIAPGGPPVVVPGGARRDELGVLARAMTATAGELVRANAELARSISARDDFLSIASHELKTPLTAMKLQLQGGLRRWTEVHGTTPAPGWGPAALRQIDRIEALVANLLDLARIRTGRLTLATAPVDLAELARGAAERLGPVLARTGNALEVDAPGRVPIAGDAARIEQVLANLLVNASQHAPGARVVLRAGSDGARAVVSVEDDGPGIPPDACERVFDPYEKVDRADRGPGLGLGLHIARQIAEAHGGTIRAASGTLGGARLVLELPRAPGGGDAERHAGVARAP